MKESISNNIGTKLIKQMGFSIIDTSSFPASTIKYSLYKEIWGALHIVNFADADAMDLTSQDIIKERINMEVQAFRNAVGTIPVLYFKVFITQNGIPAEKASNVMECYDHSTASRTTLIPIIVDLSVSRVLNSMPKMDKIGLSGLAMESLSQKESYPGFDHLDDVFKNSVSTRQDGRTRPNTARLKPYVTYSIIAINILMFVIVYLIEQSGNPYAIVTMGAKVNELIIRGEYWRLLSSAFLHSGILHIAFNMYGLLNAGSMVEKLYGRKKFVFIYLSSALVGSVSSFAFSKAPSVGASGAIFGLFGALLYIWSKKRGLFSASFGINIIAVLVVNIIYGFTSLGIDNFAHIGGLLGGYISSNAVGLWDEDLRSNYSKKTLMYIVLVCIFAGLLVYGNNINIP
jgi:rhomboid protease GluP